jgi:integrase/recombinase XerD
MAVELGHPLPDDYMRVVAARARANTLLATAYDLNVFFEVVAKQPEEITTADVLRFIADQRAPRRGGNVVPLEDGESGLSARTITRRLSSLSGLFSYLIACDDIAVVSNPVPRGLSTRKPTLRRRGVPLVRAPRTLQRLLEPDEVGRLLPGCEPAVTPRWSRRRCWAGSAVAESSACASLPPGR